MSKKIEKTPRKTGSSKKTTTAIVPQNTKISKAPYTPEQIALITRTVAKGATPDELALFMVIANKSGLDPFSRQIHFVKRKMKQGGGAYVEVGTAQTGIDGYRAIAERSKQYAGSDDIIYDTEEGSNPKKATATVYRIVHGARVAFTATARWSEYIPSAPNDFMWKKMPFLMLGKVAEALALRKAFPNDLSGIYVAEEMERTGTVVTGVVVDVPKQVTPVIPATIQPSALLNLYATAREFGAEPEMESIFIQEQLSIDIDWDSLTNIDIARLRTQLMAKLATNGGGK